MTNGNPRYGFRALPALALSLLATALPAFGKDAAGAQPRAGEAGRAYDLRTTLGVAAPSLSAAQARAASRLRAEVPSLLISADERTGGVRTLSNATGYLTGTNGGDAERIAFDFVSTNSDLFGLSSNDLRDYEVTDRATSETSGVTHIYLRQRHDGLAVYNGQLHANVTADGRLLSINSQFVPDLGKAVNTTRPAISSEEAVAAFAGHLGAAELGATPTEPQLMLLPIRPGEVRLVWNFSVDLPRQAHWYDVTVDAVDARVWTRFDWVSEAQYRVYQRPVEAPTFTAPLPPADGRTLQVDPQNATASPFGWHDTNGVAGAEFTIHRGNNVHAYDDIDNNNVPPAAQPDCLAALNCDFPINLNLAPNQYIPASVSNLFYWNNVIHDVAFLYGFTPANANFQVNTYGGGGIGNDDVQAEAQDGSGTNNANFATPPDGSRPRMQMYIWTAPTPDRDGDIDNGIIVHEYGHGISNRLVGGGTNVSCLQNAEQPGEGLSDWWSLFYTFEAANPDVRGIGTYALNQATNGPGIRTQRYDKAVEPNTNTWTYASVMGSVIPHGVGEKWAQAYWYVMGRLIDEHGFNSNVYAFTGTAADAGNIRAMFYIIEGLENAVCSPGFVDVRNAIIAAATASYGGEDVCLLWQAFADYGLGFSASQGSSNSINDQTPAFDIPASCQGGGGNEFCATPNIAVPDNVPAGVNTTMTIPDTGTLTDLDVQVTGTHTWVGDIIFRLTHVGSGTTVTYYDRPGVPATTFGCSGDNFPGVWGDDEGTNGSFEANCLNAIPAFIPDGRYTGNNPLSAFDGQDLSGDWTLNISDNAGGDTGTITEWCILATATPVGEPDIVVDPTSIDEEVTPGGSVTVPLDIENVGTADLDWTIEETELAFASVPAYLAAPVQVGPGRAGQRAADLAGTGVPSRRHLDRRGGKSSVASATQGGGAILNQLPNGVNGFFSDAACGLCGTGQQSIADNFALSTSETIGTITLWSGYFPGDVPNTTDHWTVILHANAGGVPGAPVYTENDVAHSEVQTGIILFGVHEWEVTLSLATPQVLAPGTYWLEIFNNSGTGGSPDDVFWETGDPDTVGNGLLDSVFAQQTPGVTWLANGGDLAVQLDGPGGGGGCSDPTDIPWLSLDTTSGTTAAGDTDTVQVTLDSASLGNGTFEAVLCIVSNDPDTPEFQVPVTFTVSGEPDIDVTPTSLSSSLGPDEQETQTLDIDNLGSVDLDWSFEEAPPTPRPSIPASDGRYPRGRFPPSAGMAPNARPQGSLEVAAQPFDFGTTPAYSWNSQSGPYYTVFDLGVPEVLPNVAPFPGNGQFIGAGELVNGLVYMVNVANTMWEVDPATGAILDTFTATAPSGGETWSGMALDPTSGVVYAGATNVATSSLWTMDVTTGVATLVGNITNCPGLIALAVDGAGDLWGYDIIADVLLSIDKTTGAGTIVGPIGFDANFGQGMGYDAATDTVYMAAFNNGTFVAELRSVDTTTGNTTLVGVLGATTPGGLNQLSWLGLELAGGPCSSPSDLPWVSVDPTSGTTAPAATTTVDVTFDSTGLAAGTYEGFLCIASNDPDEALVEVPVTLTVDSMPFLDGFETGDTSRWSFVAP